ncbi:GNAT family N-acetyltransferase [Ornithinimicrobium faecis]|uniref:GNAT family N-acetyltransferase n=1 Tax=Ornithinimicrobium faecis TaxID=2934158 RepID=UPI0021175F12|nr:GNAT family N-acetyltransferase [Ornithinimicrobium sp. HY1745]
MLDITRLPLQDGTVRLRPLTRADAAAYAEGTTDPAVRARAHLPEAEYTPESVAAMADGVVREGLQRGDLAVLTIADAGTDEFAGSLVIFDVSQDEAEVGFWLHPRSRGRGVAGSALQLSARFATASGLHALTARTVPDNTAAQAVLSRAGFVETGRGRGTTPSGQDVEMVHYRRDLRATTTLDWSVTWHAGHPSPAHDPAPKIQTHWVADDLVVLRQNKSVHFEAPFMFLILGRSRALLIDTGATADPEDFPLRQVVDELIDSWWSGDVPHAHELLVAHTHGHGDHRAADGQFADRPRTTVVGHSLPEVLAHYGFGDWPATPRQLDLGERVLDVIPAPGHHPSATAFYDRRTGLLLTGDSLYPGRLYVEDWEAFVASVDRLVTWSQEHPISYAVGCHIELSAAGQEYPMGTTHHPDEPPLQMPASALTELQTAVREIDGQQGRHAFDRFRVWHLL